MSDINFYCTSCGQRIACDESYCGDRVTCPTCSSGVKVPIAASPYPLPTGVTAPVRKRGRFEPRVWFVLEKNTPKKGPFTRSELLALYNEQHMHTGLRIRKGYS